MNDRGVDDVGYLRVARDAGTRDVTGGLLAAE